MYRGIFFDFGGTLVTEESDLVAHGNIYRSIIERFKLDLTPENIDSAIRSRIESALENSEFKWERLIDHAISAIEEILSANRIFLTSEDRKWLEDIYVEMHARHLELFPGVKDTLQFLRSKDIHLGIISDIDDSLLYATLSRRGIKDLFDSITTSEEVGVGKPNPLIFRKALKKARLRPEWCIYVGNSVRHDVIGAKRIGMTAVFLGREPEVDPDYVAGDFNELREILQKLIP
ncbi:MAG: hypothetical protein DRQ04_02425 [Candidatus Hydrothermota bacterium]|nr:MAG: hypothetical protein DRQ04_02425 [Candidatus Hydrothermae bacterium]